MKPLKLALKSVVKGLKVMTKEVEKIERILDALEAGQTPRKPKTKAKRANKAAPKRKATPKRKTARRPAGKLKKETAVGAVMGVLKKSRKGVTTAQIKAQTGFSDKKIWDTVNRLKREGKVKSVKRGLYQKA